MELDKRIKTITDIKSVTDGCHDWELMNKKGYFANRIVNFTDLSTCAYGEYTEYREHDQCFLCENDKTYYSYFLPEDVLEPVEKKYRPYKMEEEKPISLEKYIEDLEHFYKIYSLGDTNGDMAEELMVYECLISWLKELQEYRSKK